jgi:hypothetical protein
MLQLQSYVASNTGSQWRLAIPWCNHLALKDAGEPSSRVNACIVAWSCSIFSMAFVRFGRRKTVNQPISLMVMVP